MKPFCYTSKQCDEYSAQEGAWLNDQLRAELICEDSKKMAFGWLKSAGRKHCKYGMKPMLSHKQYIDAYAKQYAHGERLVF
jgi:hypothetical protein